MSIRFAAVWIACASAALTPTLCAAEDDPVLAGLEKAKANYASNTETFRAAVIAWFDRREDAARRSGDKKAVDAVKTERLAYEAKGELRAPPASLKSQLGAGRATMEAAYRAAIRDYTRRKQDGQAAAVEKQLDLFRGGTVRPPDVAKFGGKYYKVFPEYLAWDEARRKCEEMGGRLAVIDSAERNRFVADLAAGSGMHIVWIGASCDRKSRKWSWIDGRKMEYANWGPNQPNGANGPNPELNLSLTASGRGNWSGKWADLNDHPGRTDFGYVCEWD